VAAYDNHASVVGVGFDFACGNAAIRANLTIDSFDRPMLEHVTSEIQREISFGVGRAGSHTRDWGSAKKRWLSTVLWRR
jgi:tRNA-splicing ligase RtcB